MIGWRFWGVMSTGSPVLTSPWHSGPTETWTDANIDETCWHQPAVTECHCGVYACLTPEGASLVQDAWCQWLAEAEQTLFGREDPIPRTTVLGRLEMADALEQRYGHLDRRPGSTTELMEIRARRARILDLYVPDGWSGQRPPRALRRQLARMYGVPVHAGFPDEQGRSVMSEPDADLTGGNR